MSIKSKQKELRTLERAEDQARVKGAVDYDREIEAKGEKPCLKAVADKFLIARPTLSQRVSGKSKSKQEESEKRRAIPVEAEKVLVDYLSEASHGVRAPVLHGCRIVISAHSHTLHDLSFP